VRSTERLAGVQVPQIIPFPPVGSDWSNCEDQTTFARLLVGTTQ
jgi:hypothetical protein